MLLIVVDISPEGEGTAMQATLSAIARDAGYHCSGGRSRRRALGGAPVGVDDAERDVAQVNGGGAQAAHALRLVRELLEQVHVGRPRRIVLVPEPCHLRRRRTEAKLHHRSVGGSSNQCLLLP